MKPFHLMCSIFDPKEITVLSRGERRDGGENYTTGRGLSDLSAISFYRWQDERKREIARKHKVLKYHGHETNRKILSEKKGKFYVCERIAKKFLFIICDF